MIVKLFAVLMVGWMGALSALVAWPMVTDAPWEADAEPVRIVATKPTPCEEAWQQLAEAGTEIAAERIWARLSLEECKLPDTSFPSDDLFESLGFPDGFDP